MKRSVIADLVRQGSVPWVQPLPETRGCVSAVRGNPSRRAVSCSLRAGWMFTAGPSSTALGGPYCWVHLIPILASGAEQVRLEDLLRTPGTV